jgi:hypothetical protein
MLAATHAAFGQAEVEDLPLPIASPVAIDPGVIEPLTPKQKAVMAVKNTFWPQSLANRAVLAGINQWMDKPEEWGQGMEGYGKRFANRIARGGVRQAVQLGPEIAFGIDPRYDRCDCAGAWPRMLHAWRRVVVARRDDGSEMLHVSRFAGAYVTPIIAYQWYPDRYQRWGRYAKSGTEFLAMRALNNMVKEFWPDIRRAVFRRKD